MLRASLTLSALLLGACSVGEVDIGGAGDDGSGSGSGSSTDFVCANRGTPGVAYDHGGTTTHADEPQGCVSAGCHLDGTGGAPLFQFGGTLHNTDGTPSLGATVQVMHGGVVKSMVTDDAGNFHLDKGLGFDDPFPAQTAVTACPTVTKMGGNLIVGGGNCNSCHNSTQTAQSTPITLAN